jgi:hypothetical protein
MGRNITIICNKNYPFKIPVRKQRSKNMVKRAMNLISSREEHE